MSDTGPVRDRHSQPEGDGSGAEPLVRLPARLAAMSACLAP